MVTLTTTMAPSRARRRPGFDDIDAVDELLDEHDLTLTAWREQLPNLLREALRALDADRRQSGGTLSITNNVALRTT
jgi:hypothetical protein